MPATFLGVRHHSPACAQLAARAIAGLRPAYVLIEGPSDFNDRLDELLLGHELPIAVFTSYADEDRSHASWTPFCEYSPEWAALTEGRAAGAEVRFIDLPAWHPAFAGQDNRYADAEQRYAEVTGRLCREFAVDNVDALWDHLAEVDPRDGLAERLTTYFDLLRGEAEAGEDDQSREEYMAAWVRAAVADAGDRPVLVVTGGFHTPALRALAAEGPVEWPVPPVGGASYLVPYSYKRLDSFTGYQSGMPSPGYYQRVWADGVRGAADGLLGSVVDRLRRRGQHVSTADLIAARTLGEGLARLRGHAVPSRTDVLDGLVSALVSEDLDQPPPWTRRGPLAPGAHPVIVEMVAALSGDQVGRLHPRTPAPPLVADVEAVLIRHGLEGEGAVRLSLPRDRERSRVLHRLRVLGIPGFGMSGGMGGLATPSASEHWELTPSDLRLPALIEAGAYGPTLGEAAGARLRENLRDADIRALARILLDAALCGIGTLPADTVPRLIQGITTAHDLPLLGGVLGDVLALWRHDSHHGTASSPTLGAVVNAAVVRVLWLVDGMRGGDQPADPGRIRALVGVRDAVRHAPGVLDHDPGMVLAVARRVRADEAAPLDLRGAACGLAWMLGDPVDADQVLAVGDWLAGLFAMARDEVLGSEDIVGLLDRTVSSLSHNEFLVALPALRQAFGFFPPLEREAFAAKILAHRGISASARSMVRLNGDPYVRAEAIALEATVERLLAREGLA